MSWVFETTCVNSDGPSINAMRAVARPVTYRTLRRHLGKALVAVEARLAYDTGHESETGLRLSKDWAVSYAKSTYRGEPCFYFVWSHIEHIFVRSGQRPSAKRR